MSLPIPDATLRVALFEPRIPPNTGNIARTCAAFQLPLALIEPLGFQIDDKNLRRAGLDYWPHVQLSTHGSLDQLLDQLPQRHRLIGLSRREGTGLGDFRFESGDVLLFGREDTGLPEEVRSKCDAIVTIPMPGAADSSGQGGVRSLNLSVACAIVCFSAGRQLRMW